MDYADLKIRKFQQFLINYINQTDLAIEIKRLVVFEIMNQLNAKSDEVITNQQRALQEEQESEVKQDAESISRDRLEEPI